MLENFEASRPIDYSFHILNSIKQGDFTKWSIVYDINEMAIYFTTSNNQERKKLNVHDFDFSCSSPVLYTSVDVNVKGSKDFNEYSVAKNLEMIERIFQILATKPAFVNLVPSKDEQIDMANYPNATYCSGQE